MGRTWRGRYLVFLFGGLLVVFAAMAAANYALDPLKYSRGYMAEVSGYFARGLNLPLTDRNFNIRALRREHLQRLPAAPQVMVFGGSRMQYASGAVVPGRTFYNTWVYADGFEDVLAVSEMLLSNDRMPETFVISVRHKSFIPLGARETADWKQLAPEYRAMAQRLGLPRPSWAASLPIDHWSSLLSVSALARKARLLADHGGWSWTAVAHATPVVETVGKLDVLRADGSLGMSERYRRLDTMDNARKEALKTLAQDRTRRLEVDPAAVDGFGRLLAFLKPRTQVVLLMTPMHPAYYTGVSGTPFGQGLVRTEAEVRRLAEINGIQAIGSFDPARARCAPETFQDHIHVREECIRQLLRPLFAGRE